MNDKSNSIKPIQKSISKISLRRQNFPEKAIFFQNHSYGSYGTKVAKETNLTKELGTLRHFLFHQNKNTKIASKNLEKKDIPSQIGTN